jgi:hypothetical protein
LGTGSIEQDNAIIAVMTCRKLDFAVNKATIRRMLCGE